MKKITLGILAHVDAGKTTLSEALLYSAGAIRHLGRVDHGDAFLDTDAQERERGITIFSKQALLQFPNVEITLLDTPGHTDFSTETERTLRVLDCAVLVISARDGVQGHTLTLWKLLQKYRVPAFIFINKMDLEGADRTAVMKGLTESLDSGCVDFSGCEKDIKSIDFDALSMCSEKLMEEILETGAPDRDTMGAAVAAGTLYPCVFGSALRMQGLESLVWCLENLSSEKGRSRDFGARVYKITRDAQGTRLTHLKVTGGDLRVRDEIAGEKVTQIRLYNGDRFTAIDRAGAGTVCAAVGLTGTFAGQGLGIETSDDTAVIEPVMVYRVVLTDGTDPFTAYSRLKQLAEEDPQLRISWDESAKIIQLSLMGDVQLEVLKRLIKERFDLDVDFGDGRVSYRETISSPVVGCGHFEPLRHYAEVHLLIEPGDRGSGIVIDTAVSSDRLDTNWQRLIFTHLTEREFPGALCGFPVTDIKITLIGGRAHVKHTEGGDFRQATYRAVRQGLMKAMMRGDAVVLEPWYEFHMELPADQSGRAMADIQKMGGSFEAPVIQASGPDGLGTGGTGRGPADGSPASGSSGSDYQVNTVVIDGRAPASELREYSRTLAGCTRGFGRLTLSPSGYDTCHNQEEVEYFEAYDPEWDQFNTGDSVFCEGGTSICVPWNESDLHMHIPVGTEFGLYSDTPDGTPDITTDGTTYSTDTAASGSAAAAVRGSGGGHAGAVDDAELMRIFERTYGQGSSKGRRRDVVAEARIMEAKKEYHPTKPMVVKPEFLFVDGYNVIFAWEDLKELARENIDSAREALIEILENYQGYRKCRVRVVFDAYRIKGGTRREGMQGGVEVVYTGEDETADTYIERTTYKMDKEWDLRVVSSDRLVQMMVSANGARRVSSAEFRVEVDALNEEIRSLLDENSRLAEKEARTLLGEKNKPVTKI